MLLKKSIKAELIKIPMIIALLLSTQIIISQETEQVEAKEPSEFWKHVRFGGGIGLGFGNGTFSGTLAPVAIYEFNQQFGLGLGLNGTYTKTDISKSTILGGSLIGLYSPFNGLQLSAEFEELYVNRNYELDEFYTDDSYWYPALHLGAGYRSGGMVFGLRYDVLFDDDKSVYTNALMPFFRFYF